MTIEVWPQAGDPTRLGEKAQGLIDLLRINLPVPSALILRSDALTRPDIDIDLARETAIEQILRFHASLKSSHRAISLRCAVKGPPGASRILPESVLGLGILDAADADASEAVCIAHAAAFFTFFGQDLPAGFPRLPLRNQLEAMLIPLLPHLSNGLLFGAETPRTLVAQQMVYGDRDARSLTGICYTRHPHTGEATEYGRFIVGRQGMALGGVNDPAQRDLSEMVQINPVVYAALTAAFPRVETYHGAVRQLEFTAEGETLYLLQNTSGNSTFRLGDGA